MMTVILDLLRPAGRETAPDPPVTTRKPCRASRLAKIVPAREICRENVRLGNASPLVQIWRPWQRPAIIQWRRRKKTRLAPADARKKPRQNSRKKKDYRQTGRGRSPPIAGGCACGGARPPLARSAREDGSVALGRRRGTANVWRVTGRAILSPADARTVRRHECWPCGRATCRASAVPRQMPGREAWPNAATLSKTA